MTNRKPDSCIFFNRNAFTPACSKSLKGRGEPKKFGHDQTFSFWVWISDGHSFEDFLDSSLWVAIQLVFSLNRLSFRAVTKVSPPVSSNRSVSPARANSQSLGSRGYFASSSLPLSLSLSTRLSPKSVYAHLPVADCIYVRGWSQESEISLTRAVSRHLCNRSHSRAVPQCDD